MLKCPILYRVIYKKITKKRKLLILFLKCTKNMIANVQKNRRC